MIALIVTERSPKNMPTLIVCPTGLIDQWRKEIDKYCAPAAGVNVLVYHGPYRVKDARIIASYDVVVTSYALLTMEAAKLHKGKNDKGPKIAPQKRSNDVKALSEVNWFCIILDECQSVKNPDSKGSTAAASYMCKRRWCLSGTPVQNRPFELHSYYRFLRHFPFASKNIFETIVSNAAKENDYTQQHRDLIGQSFAAISLRRTKGRIRALFITFCACLYMQFAYIVVVLLCRHSKP